MSDAITLDVLSSSPVQLDAGDADPIAREEIAELATRVTTVEGDVSGLSTRMGAVEGDVTALDGRMDAAEGDISTLGTTVDGIDARVEAIEADYVTSEDVMDALGGEAPTLVSGSSRALLGDPETASWMERTTAADGAALIEAVQGNTIVQDGSLLPVRMEGVETVAADESWSSQRTIPAATYFPQGLRSAGTVYDELRADAAVTRVGAVDLGTLNWTYLSDYSAFFSTGLPIVKSGYTNSSIAPMTCSKYETKSFYSNGDYFGGADKVIAFAFSSGERLYVKDSTAGTDAVTFKTAMSGVMLYYALATPTTTPIDPPLPLSYRVGAGGTERVMVASGTTSAPPIFVTRYPLDPADLAASIAPRESTTAEANHAVGDLIMLGFTLCKVTTSIARGEAITIGTNVTRTSVAAEIAALS